ncbi:MAG: bifunctional 4-hydroxy-2-oxoglutarate aldolase/2-dehydro-3-deoxy-phosphogluconate aldolase [Chloroflexi bacterium]|nr:bifunctional 4-hydroxy-2-oxoglutarate aldolase/2-dehydro-3-deoxy-phosphogluconate aldolase [Chloroflexota bacterium]
MASHLRLHIYNTLLETGVVPLFYHHDLDTAKKIVEACLDGGAKVVEFTNRGDFAYDVFSALAKYYAKARPDLILGVGSVADAPTAALFIAGGANFIVGPSFNPEIARLCNRRKIPYMPGCATLREIAEAEELGVEIVKLFPGETIGGPAFVKALLAPCPWTRAMPTGGVDATQESLQAWFKAGVACVGIGSKLVAKKDVDAGDFAAIAARVKQVRAWIDEAR